MKKEITFSPAFDKRNKNPNKNYGINGVDIRFVLSGELGATQFVLCTNWHLPNVQKELIEGAYKKGISRMETLLSPLPADVGYHSPVPQYEGQTIISESCPYLNGKPCYYEGSGLQAKKVFDILIEKGDAGVWEYLEEYYIEKFGKLK